MAENQPRRGGSSVSPGREPWVEWEIDLSLFRDDRVLTHTLQSERRAVPTADLMCWPTTRASTPPDAGRSGRRQDFKPGTIQPISPRTSLPIRLSIHNNDFQLLCMVIVAAQVSRAGEDDAHKTTHSRGNPCAGGGCGRRRKNIDATGATSRRGAIAPSAIVTGGFPHAANSAAANS